MKTRLARAGLVAAMVVVTINLWTGAPLLALWVGSRVAPSSGISMGAVAVIVIVLLVVCMALVRLLAVLGAVHDRISGHEATVRRHTPWLRAMSGERPRELGGAAPSLTALDYVLVAVVVLSIVAFEIWFFFIAGSPFDSRSGR